MEELVEGGAQAVTATSGRWFQGGGYRVGCEAPGNTFISRPFLERGLRGRLEAMPQVTFVRAAVTGVRTVDGAVVAVTVADGDGSPPTSSSMRPAGFAGIRVAGGCGLPAAPGGPGPRRHGLRHPRLSAHAGRLPDGTWMVTIGDPRSAKRFGVAFPIEGDRWIVTLAGVHGDHAPSDDDGFPAWADTLPTPDIAELIGDEEPFGPIVTHRLPSDQWRHFEKIKRAPAGFVALATRSAASTRSTGRA